MRGLLKIPPQVIRLILLTLLIVSSYLVMRHVMTPSSFGKYGWYRGDALEEIASREPVWAGRKACVECHSEEAHRKVVAILSCNGLTALDQRANTVRFVR